MKPPKYLFVAVFLLTTVIARAQTVNVLPAGDFPRDESMRPINIVKLNLPALVLKNISLQYERVLTRKSAVALSIRVMPKSTIPFKNLIIDEVGDDDPDTKETIEKVRFSNFAITPEFRWYVGREGYGKGFYIAPFYRFAGFKSHDLTFYYEDDFFNQQSIALSGKLTSHTAGILFGAQWVFGKSIVLDWWILGPHYGVGNGNFSGVSSTPLSPSEQDDLRQELEDLDIPLTNKTVTVNANGANLKLDGPWGGVRAGISLGVRF